MAINLAPGALDRSGSFFNATQSWTIALWARPHTSTPTTGNFRQYYNFGIGSGSYVFLGSNFASDDLILEVSDGTNFYDTTVVSLPLGAWAIISATYDATTHLLTLYKDNVVVGTLTHDLSAFPAFVAGEHVGTWGDHQTAQIRLWQAALSPAELAVEATTPLAVRTANLLADTPLLTASTVTDSSGNGRHWTASGTLSTVPGPYLSVSVSEARTVSESTTRRLTPLLVVVADTCAVNSGATTRPPRFTRVQETGKVHGGSSPTITIPFQSPPTRGNGIVVLLSLWKSNPNFPAWTCTDNYGHTYHLAALSSNSGVINAAVFYCPSVGVTAAPFVITLQPPTGFNDWVASAIEVSPVGWGLRVDQTALQTGSGPLRSTGTTPPLAADDAVLAAVVASDNSSFTEITASDLWVEAFEELNGSAYNASEGDTRLQSGLQGAAVECHWTTTPTFGSWAAALVAFATSSGPYGIETCRVTDVLTIKPLTMSVSVRDFITTANVATRLIPKLARVRSDAVTVTDVATRGTSMTRVQATPKVTAQGTGITLTFTTPPMVGSGIVVLVNHWGGDLTTGVTVTDTRGNAYYRAVYRRNSGGSLIYYCERVEQSGSPFAITLTGLSTWYVGAAVEVSGTGTGMVLEQAVGATGTSTAPATGATAALTHGDVFLAALHEIHTNQGSITVGAATPPWLQEFEELTTAFAAGEGDTRAVTGALGTTPSASWTGTASAAWAAALAVFWRDTQPRVSAKDICTVTESVTRRLQPLVARLSETSIVRERTYPPPPPPLSLVITVTAKPGSGGGATAAATTTGADLLVLSVSSYSGGSVVVSDSKGNIWIPLTKRGVGTENHHQFFYAKNANVGTGHTFTVTGSSTYPAIIVHAFAGGHLYSPFERERGAVGFMGTPLAPGSLLPENNGSLLVTGFCSSGSLGAITGIGVTGAGLTQTVVTQQANVSCGGGTGWVIQGTAAALDPVWTWAGLDGDGTASHVVFRPATRPVALSVSVAETIHVWDRTPPGPSPWTLIATTTGAFNSGNGMPGAAIGSPLDTTGADLLVLSVAWLFGNSGEGYIFTDSKGNTYVPLTKRVGVPGPGYPPAGLDALCRFFYVKNASVGPGHVFSISAPVQGSYPVTVVVYAFAGSHPEPVEGEASGATVTTLEPSVVSGPVEPGSDRALIMSGYVQKALGTTWPTDLTVAPAMTETEKPVSYGGKYLVATGWMVQPLAAPVSPEWSWTGGGAAIVTTVAFRARDSQTRFPEPALRRVRATARGYAETGPFTLTFPTGPALGNGLVVIVGSYANVTPFRPFCVDNAGNYYRVAVSRYVTGGTQGAAVIFYCDIVRQTSSPLVLTITGVAQKSTGVAVEVSGVGPFGLAPNQVAAALGQTVGPLPPLTVPDAFLAAINYTYWIGDLYSQIVVDAASPTWTEEYEAITSLYVGEADTRIVGNARGTTPSVHWTLDISGNSNLALAAFGAGTNLSVIVIDTVTVTHALAFSPMSVKVAETISIVEDVVPPVRRLRRKQGSGKVSATISTFNAVTIPFLVPFTPTVGNALVVLVSAYQVSYAWGTSGTGVVSCTDNYGNVYKPAVNQSQGQGHAAIFHALVAATGSPLTITLATSAYYYTTWNISVVEVEVLNGTGLLVDRTASSVGSGTAITTGVTLPLTASEVFSAAVHTGGAPQVSITVAAGWREEYEVLTFNHPNQGGTWSAEGDTDLLSRAGPGVVGSTVSANWTVPTSEPWSAVLAAFSGGVLQVSVKDVISVTEGRSAGLRPLARKVFEAIGVSESARITPPTLVRVQGTGKVWLTSDNQSEDVVSCVFPVPPTVGNTVVVMVSMAEVPSPPTCADNYGNVYQRVAWATASYYVGAGVFVTTVGTTGAGFTVTLTAGIPGEWPAWVLSAVEIAPAHHLGLALASAVSLSSQPVYSDPPRTPPLPPLTAKETLLVAVLAHDEFQLTYLTVKKETNPAWTEEYEELNRIYDESGHDVYSDILGEGDTRIVQGTGLTPYVEWDAADSNDWAAVLVAFMEALPGPTRLVSSNVTVTDAVIRTFTTPPQPFVPVPMRIGVFEVIRVTEDRLRVVDSSKLTVRAYDYVKTIEAMLPAIYGTAWDGGGTPPAPTPGVTDDYWLTGI